jgi:CheY-like chemotaxis protein
VWSAANVQSALAILPQIGSLSLIILGMNMPIKNGDDFIEAIKRDSLYATIPIFITSDLAQLETNVSKILEGRSLSNTDPFTLRVGDTEHS